MEKLEKQGNSQKDWTQFFKKYKKLTDSQKRFLRAYDARLLNVSTAAEVAGVARSTVYEWIDKSDTFKKAKSDIEEDFYDKLETSMFSKAIVDKDNTMLIFLAKTKMKHRGYVERVEQDVSINPFEALMKAVDQDSK